MKKLFLTLTLSIIFLLTTVSVVNAQYLSLDPVSGSKASGSEFTVNLNINTEGKSVVEADAQINFDTQMLEVVKVEKGGFFTDEADNIDAGRIAISGFFRESFATKAGSGTVATITLKGKKIGTADLSFACSTETSDTNIVDSSFADLIVCSKTKDASYTITEGTTSGGNDNPGVGGTELSPTPTKKVTPTPTPKKISPTPNLPVSGNILPTNLFLGGGILLLIVGIVMVFI